MKFVSVLALAALGACAPISRLFHSRPSDTESLYWQAVENLDVSNKSGTLDSAIAKLDAYLASRERREHEREARVLLTLAHNSQQLARVEATLEQTKAAAVENRPRESSDTKARDEDSLKEIQRLKDELAAANAELERIKKRLAAPPTKP